MVETARSIIALHPETVRIYPTIVLKGTTLAALYADGYYKPQTVDEAVNICVKLLSLFKDAGIRVIRLGLHSIERKAYISGPWHPAFSELCHSEIMLQKALALLEEKGNYTLFTAPTDISKMIGQNRMNIEKLNRLGYICKVMPDSRLGAEEIYVKKG